MQRTQRNVLGMNVQQQSWNQLDSLLPCSGCVAGKMRKTNRGLPVDYSDVKVLAVSRTPATQIQSNRRNETVSVDWAIVNKENLVDVSMTITLALSTLIFNLHEDKLERHWKTTLDDGVYPKQYTTTMHKNSYTANLQLSARNTTSAKPNQLLTAPTKIPQKHTWNS